MIISIIILNLIIISTFGYSILLKKLLYNSLENKLLYNFDIFTGFACLYLFSFFINLFFPLHYYVEVVFFIGLLLFFWFLKKIQIKFNIYLLMIILSLIIFASYSIGIIYDSALYHLQIIKWLSDYKVSFGLSNLEPRFGTNSFWQSLIALFNSKKINIEIIYLLNFIPFAVLINELFKYTKINPRISYHFLLSSVLFLLIFAIIHPDINGPIFNTLRSPEVDMIAVIFFIFSVYFFLKYYEEKNISDYNNCFMASTLGFITKLSHFGLLFLPLVLFLNNSNKILFSKINVFCLFLISIWIIKSYILSGCWFFPINFTCFPLVSWSTPVEEILLYKNIVSSFARSHSYGMNFMNFDYTLNSFQWVIPWMKTYILNGSFFIICFFMIFLSFVIFFIQKFLFPLSAKSKDKYFLDNYTIMLLIFFFITNFTIWFQAPDIRFGYGAFISCISLIFASTTYYFFLRYNIITKTKIIIFILLIILCSKNYQNLAFLNKPKMIINDNSSVKFYKNINGYKIFKSNAEHSFCKDFVQICVIIPSELHIEENNGYLYFIRKNKN
jgi:hypothetical protein